MRLDRFLSAGTMYSRRELKRMIQNGQVTQNGRLVKKPDAQVYDGDAICINGAQIPSDKYLYILLNKPRGYVCSASEPGQNLAVNLIPLTLRRKDLQPVGRLDKDSTGMLLFTNDGQLSHQLISTRSHAKKYYHVRLARPWADTYADAIAAGITLRDGAQCLPAYARPIPGRPREMLICLEEGKYHQVRRMMAALGNHVSDLSRVAIGGFPMPQDLPEGRCQVLDISDVQKILQKESDFSALLQKLAASPTDSKVSKQ